MKSTLVSRFIAPASGALAALVLLNGCKDSQSHGDHAAGHSHEDHAPPHGGTPVIVGEDSFHLELVLDATAAKMQAYVLDGHLEGYVAVAETNLLLVAKFDGKEEKLSFHRAIDPASGLVPAKSSLFEGNAAWLGTTRAFEGSFPTITLNGTTFTNISFSFPKGSKHVH
jgi:hypothetical protein